MPSRPFDNERKACDAVARSLEQLAGTTRSNGYSPEDDGAEVPIEYVFDLRSVTYAIEHTIVEAFGEQIRTDVSFSTFIEPITECLDHRLPSPGKYNLFFPIYPTKGMNPKDIAKAQEGIIEWVKKSAAELYAECPEQPERNDRPPGHKISRTGLINGIELQLFREIGWCMPETAKGRLFVVRIAPQHLEALRLERVHRAVGKKLPKLDKWKKGGARSVLVLENRDLAVSNHVNILEAVEHALKGRPEQPDEVWLVDTVIETEWVVSCLIRDGVSFPDEDTTVRYRKFDPEQLTPISS